MILRTVRENKHDVRGVELVTRDTGVNSNSETAKHTHFKVPSKHSTMVLFQPFRCFQLVDHGAYDKREWTMTRV